MGLRKKKVGFYLEDLEIEYDKNFNNEEHFWQIEKTENEREKETIRELIFKNNVPFAKHCMNRCVRGIQATCEYTRTTYDEFCSIGFTGLWKAIQTFDVTKNIKFSTFAGTVIRNDYNMFLRSVKRSYSVQVSSLDAPLHVDDDGSELTGLDLLADQVDLISIFDDLDTLDSILRHVMKTCKDRDMNILYHHLEGLNQKEIAEKYGITQSYASRIVNKVQDKLKSRKDYVEGMTS
ncbi:RNA polymerase sporulation specific sigma factor [Bacillus phage SP8]|uniref:RNA polymerase sigma factor n=1 Tax=Bacillus phage Adastra TaxID=3143958 RepID=A0AAU8BB61_9CAUD|nr:RNA polymerase sporulation specific sigma factor [Bacillus phage SP8]